MPRRSSNIRRTRHARASENASEVPHVPEQCLFDGGQKEGGEPRAMRHLPQVVSSAGAGEIESGCLGARDEDCHLSGAGGEEAGVVRRGEAVGLLSNRGGGMGRLRYHLKVQQDRCKEKTAKGNVYQTMEFAKKIAKQMSKRTGEKIEAFRCEICRLHHVGKWQEEESRRRSKRRRELEEESN